MEWNTRFYCTMNNFLFRQARFVSFNMELIEMYVHSPVDKLHWYLALWGMPMVALNKQAREFIKGKVVNQYQYFVDLAHSAGKNYSNRFNTKTIAGFVIKALYEEKNRCASCWKQPKRLFRDYLSDMPKCPACLCLEYENKNGYDCPNGTGKRVLFLDTDSKPFRYVLLCFKQGHKCITCFHYVAEVCYTKYKRKDPGEGITPEEILTMREYKRLKQEKKGFSIRS